MFKAFINKPVSGKGRAKAVMRWLRFCFFCICVPFAAVICLLVFINKSGGKLYLQEQKTNFEEQMRSVYLYADADLFICKRLNSIFEGCLDANELKGKLSLLQRQGLAESFIVWGPNGQVLFCSAKLSEEVDLSLAWRSVRRLTVGAVQALSSGETENLRRILGPHFFAEFFKSCYKGDKLRLIRGDISQNISPAWLKATYRFGALVFVRPEYINSMPGIKEFLSQKGNSSVGFYIKNKWLGRPLNENEKQMLCASFSSFKSPIRCVGRYYFIKQLKNELCAFSAVGLFKRRGFVFYILKYLSETIFLFCCIYAAFKSYGAVVLNKPFSASLYKQIFFLFLLSDLIIILTAGAFACDYFNNYKRNLQNKCVDDGIKYLQSIDEIYLSEYSRRLKSFSLTLPQFEKRLREGGINRDLIIDFLSDKTPLPMHLFISGTNSSLIGGKHGIVSGEKFKVSYKLDNDYIPSLEKLYNSIFKVSRFYLASLNGQELSGPETTQTEIIIESLGAKNCPELLQNFWASNGKITHWGLGEQVLPIYVKALKNKSKFFDYLFVSIDKPLWLERAFINNIFLSVNRNPHGIKVIAAAGDMVLPSEAASNSEITAFAASLMGGVPTETGFCTWHGVKHLMAGLKCNKPESVCLIALFSMNEINEKVNKAVLRFGFAAAALFLIPILAGFYMAKRLYESIYQLEQGVLALQRKNYAYRLADMGNDELGHLGRVFNSALIDLEEISTAFNINSSFFNAKEQRVIAGGFEYFYKRRLTAKYPTDIFVSERFNEAYEVCIASSVCNLGLGAGLMTSFMYSCISKLKGQLITPNAFLTSVNRVLLSMTGSGKKQIAAQVVLLDLKNSVIKISNAGLSSPLILRRGYQEPLTEIKLPSRPLGVVENLKIAAAEISLKPGEMLVLYTNGAAAYGGAVYGCIRQAFADSADTKQFAELFTERLRQQGAKEGADLTVLAVSTVQKQA